MKHTKIVATLGPTSDSEEKIKELITAGVNVFRFNMKHADIAWHNERINRVQHVADTLKTHIGILIDLQGPEIRIETKDKTDVSLKKGEGIWFSPHFLPDLPSICIPHPVVFNALDVGDKLLIDDGFLELDITEVSQKGVYAVAIEDCVIKHRKGLNLLGKDIDLPSLIEDDLHKLDMAAKTKVDFVALSFSRTKKDIEILRKEMKKRNVDAHIIAKVESQAGLDHLDELIETADGIMVARGDLGIEVPIEQLAYWQKMMIAKCRVAHKPVITATQMLESMIYNPRPTRAEATDVANAVFDGTDAVMLSAESANGKYPVKAVLAMARIAQYNEQRRGPSDFIPSANDLTELVIRAAQSMVKQQNSVKIDAIVVFTETGRTARVLSSFRQEIPIIAVTDREKTVETLTLSFGVTPIYSKFPEGSVLSPAGELQELVKKQILKKGQTVLAIHGKSWKTPGLTNALAVMTV